MPDLTPEQWQPSEFRVAELSDGSLLRRMQQGSQDAGGELFRRYAPRLRALARARFSPGLALRLEPEDLVQSVFRRFVHQVRHQDCSVPEGQELWGLLLVIALNKIRSAERFHRANKRNMAMTHGDVGLQRHLETQGSPGDTEAAGMEVAIAEILERLPPRHREVARHRLEGCEVAEVAERIGRSLRTAERLLQECRAKLEAFFDDSF